MRSNLEGLIGNTPMLALKLKYKGKDRTIYAKAEHYNLTGSIKDRMAYYILKHEIEAGRLRPGMCIKEATSGNTGIAFSAIGVSLGMRVSILMPDWMSEERKKLITSYGADIQLVSREEGGFLGSIAICEESANDEMCYLPHQFENNLNSLAHYHSTGPEILEQLAFLNTNKIAFIAGVGTGGTVMGTGRYLKDHVADVKLFPLEPENSPTLSTGLKDGSHRIQGISDDFIPKIIDFSILDQIIGVHDGDAIIMAQKLSQNGIGVGISSGANLIGALKVKEILGDDYPVVTVFSDDSKKYLSTDLMKEEPVLEHFLSKDIEIVGFDSIKSPHTTYL